MCSIKALALSIDRLSLDTVIDLMMCFPCLEKLYIQVTILHCTGGSMCSNTVSVWSQFVCRYSVFGSFQPRRSENSNLWRRKHRKFIESFDIRLKKIAVLNYRGIRSQVSFANFFVLNAKLLETMRFEGGPNMEDQDFIARQHELLQVEKRASIGAQFHFTTDRCEHYLTHVKHVHDLATIDPFECTC